MNKAELLAAIGKLAEEQKKTIQTDGKSNDELKVILNELESVANEEELNLEGELTIHFVAPYRNYANGDVATFEVKRAKKILAITPAVAKEFVAEKAK
ncbi:hypothetical protein [Pseudoalteromonas piratica]|uniref:DNA-binding protein n=1 Tax=Pseudoalteromonas piratica TaxID=1348114 RepID=A0A0A7EF84_9GAMM|nr:hypothetical protein [Pseudoalteromonas piratica]AIY65193.1 hypothetical protein OM33_08495 [Pseudoalteromonas piratica]